MEGLYFNKSSLEYTIKKCDDIDQLKSFLSKNADLIDKNDFGSLYDEAYKDDIRIFALTGLLLLSDINPLLYMERVPSQMFEYVPLTQVIIPNTIEIIESWAFIECRDLEVVYIPRSVKYIGGGVFMHTTALADIYYEGSEAEWLSIYFVFDWSAKSGLHEDSIHFNAKSTVYDGVN